MLNTANPSLVPELGSQLNQTKPSAQLKAKPKKKTFNLLTYKLHALGDYVQTICLFGSTDSYSTQIVRSRIEFFLSDSYNYFHQGELAHRLVKRFYHRTNKKDAIRQIAKHE